MQKTITDLGKEKLHTEIEALKPDMEKRARRMYDVPLVNEASDYSDQMAIAMTVKEVTDGK
jgi:hypothetical protein